MNDALATFLEGTIRTATPFAFAALGETVVERSGIINIGLEGCIIAGAFAGLLSAGMGGPAVGFVGAACGGVMISALFAFFTAYLRADQIITGTAITIFSLGATGTLYRVIYGAAGAALSIPTMRPLSIAALRDLPLVGPALFEQPPITYLLYFLIPLTWWWMYRTHSGLGLRAVGENPEAAIAAGIAPRTIQLFALLFGGVMGGLSGGTLVLAQAGTFAEGMSAGRGFIAIAIVVLGRWNPLGAAVAALVFGAASALQYFFQAMGSKIPYQLFLALPYVLTLIGLTTTRRRASAPAALGRR